MQMTDAEIARSYRQAPEGQKQKQIKILSELNACDKKQIREILRSQGFDVKEPKNRWTAAKEAGQTSDCKDCAKGETCGFGKPDGVRCDAFRAKGSEGSKVSARLLKSEEQTGLIKSDGSEDVGTRQQEVGTKSEKVVTLGDLIGLIDRDKENNKTISIMDENGAEQLRVITWSPFLEDLEDYAVTSLDVGDKGWFCVWLGEKKEGNA